MSDQNEETAAHLIEYNVTDAAIAELRGKFSGLSIEGIDDKIGYDLVHRSRLEIVGLRGEVERKRKSLKESSLVWGRKVDAEARRITSALEEIETPLKREEGRIDAEVQAEKDRIQQSITNKVNQRLEALRDVNFHPDFTLSQDLAGMGEEVFFALLEEKTEAFNLEKETKAEEAAELEYLRGNDRERIRTTELKDADVSELPANLRDMEEADYQTLLRDARKAVNNRLEAEKRQLDDQRRELNRERTKQRTHRLEMLLGIVSTGDEKYRDLENIDFEVFYTGIKEKHDARLAEDAKRRDEAASLQRENEACEAALKPDREKIKAYLGALKSVPVPQMATDKGKASLLKLQAAVTAAITEGLKA